MYWIISYTGEAELVDTIEEAARIWVQEPWRMCVRDASGAQVPEGLLRQEYEKQL